MRTGLAVAALGSLVMASGIMLAAPPQTGQDRPGQIGQARVFVENTGKNQAVPVALQDAALSTPLNVQIAGTPTVAFAGPDDSPGMGLPDRPDRGGTGRRRRLVGRRGGRVGSRRHPVSGFGCHDRRLETATLTRKGDRCDTPA
jgi:hypothetical protein